MLPKDHPFTKKSRSQHAAAFTLPGEGAALFPWNPFTAEARSRAKKFSCACGGGRRRPAKALLLSGLAFMNTTLYRYIYRKTSEDVDVQQRYMEELKTHNKGLSLEI